MKKHFIAARVYADNGYALLLGVVIAGSIALAIVISMATWSNISLTNNRIELSSEKSRLLTETCIELALENIRSNSLFLGAESYTEDEQTCDYTVSDLGGESRLIESSTDWDGNVTRIKVEIDQLFPDINISAWNRVQVF